MGHADRSQAAVRGPIVSRGELDGRLARAARVVIVSAPAGSGKTFLLRSWVAAAELSERTGWVSATQAAVDPQTFWISVLDALRSTAPGADLMRGLTRAPRLDGAAIVERLLDDLSSLEEPLWLVVDDAHELGSSETLRQLSLFSLRAPERLRLVLSTRRDLRLGLHRLRLEGELTEIRANDLRFSLDEARALFQLSGATVSEPALALLHERTEGWAAGLRLAALSLARQEDPERFATEFSGSTRVVAEYLVDEVLDRLPDDVRQLLLRTSVLDRVNGPLADLLTGGSGGERILDELESANAFVMSLDAQRSWFRYHHLFSDLLALSLRREAPQEVAGLHRRAAGWFADHGYLVEAIGHAQAGEDWGLATRLLFDNWLGFWLDGASATAHDLLVAFPPDLVAADAELTMLTGADELLRGSLEQAERQLVRAGALLASVSEERRERVETSLAGMRLRLARHRGELGVVVEEAHRLLGSVQSPDATRTGLERCRRAIWMLNLGIAELWTARLNDAERHLEEARALAHRAGRPYIAIECLSNQALLALFSSFSAAFEPAIEAVRQAEEHGWEDEPVVGLAYALLGMISNWRGRPAHAAAWLDRAQRALTAELEPAEGSMMLRTRGVLELVRDRDEEALVAFRAAARLEDRMAVAHVLAAETRALTLQTMLRLGQAERVRQRLDEMDDTERAHPEMHKVTALLALADGDPEAATVALAPLIDGSVTVVHPGRLVEALLLEAIARDALGDPGASGRALERALELAESDGIVGPFLLHRAPELLERHRRQRTAHASLVAEITSLLAGRPPAANTGRPEPLPEPLSESEIRVLRYLPTNLSAPEIAGELYLGVSTVKTHVHHIYTKLGVHRRAEAVERARALGLLAPASVSRR